jgi:hypothetical protein
VELGDDQTKINEWLKYCIEINLLVENDKYIYSSSLLSRMEFYDNIRAERSKAGKIGRKKQLSNDEQVMGKCPTNDEQLDNSSSAINNINNTNNINNINKKEPVLDPVFDTLEKIDPDEALNVFNECGAKLKQAVWGRISVSDIIQAWDNLQASTWHISKGYANIYWFLDVKNDCKKAFSRIKEFQKKEFTQDVGDYFKDD